MAVRVKHGVHLELEEAADAILFGHLAQITSREEKSDVLTPWKMKHRTQREVLSRTGAAIDPSTRRGMFNRAYNPVQTHLNSYDGPTRPMKMDPNWDDEQVSGPMTISTAMAGACGVERDEF